MKRKLQFFIKKYNIDFFSYILNLEKEELINILKDPLKNFNEQQNIVLNKFIELYDITYSKYDEIEDIKLFFNIGDYFFKETNTHLFYNYNRFCGGKSIDLSVEQEEIIVLGTRIFEKILPLILFEKNPKDTEILQIVAILKVSYYLREYPYYKELLNKISEFALVKSKLKNLENSYGSTVRSSSYPNQLELITLLKTYEKILMRRERIEKFPQILRETINENRAILNEKKQSFEGIMLFEGIGIEENISLPTEFLGHNNLEGIFKKFLKYKQEKGDDSEIVCYNFGLKFNYIFNFRRINTELDKSLFENNINLQIQKIKEDMYLAFILTFEGIYPLEKEIYIYSPFVELIDIYKNDKIHNSLKKILNQEEVNMLFDNYQKVIRTNRTGIEAGVKNLVESLESTNYRTSFNLLISCLENLFNYSIKNKGIKYHLKECSSIICKNDLRVEIDDYYKLRSENLHGNICIHDYQYKDYYKKLLKIICNIFQEIYFNNTNLLLLNTKGRVEKIMGYK